MTRSIVYCVQKTRRDETNNTCLKHLSYALIAMFKLKPCPTLPPGSPSSSSPPPPLRPPAAPGRTAAGPWTTGTGWDQDGQGDPCITPPPGIIRHPGPVDETSNSTRKDSSEGFYELGKF